MGSGMVWLATAWRAMIGCTDVCSGIALLAMAGTGAAEAGVRGGVGISVLEWDEEVDDWRGWAARTRLGGGVTRFQGVLMTILVGGSTIIVVDESSAVTGVWGGVGIT